MTKVALQYHPPNPSLSVFSKQELKDLNTLFPCSWYIVAIKPSSKLCSAVRACTIWWSPATRLLKWPSKPIVSALFRLQRDHWSARKQIQTLMFAKDVRETGIHLCVVSWTSCRNVRVNKQAIGYMPTVICSEWFGAYRFNFKHLCLETLSD